MLYLKPAGPVQLTLYGQYRSAPQVNDPLSTSGPRGTVGNSTFTGAAFLGFKADTTLNFGVEGFLQSTAHSYAPPATAAPSALKSLNTMGVSVWAGVNFSSEWGAVARYDYFEPNSGTGAEGDVRNFILGSLVYRPDKNVWIMPNVLAETYQAPPGGRALDPSVTVRMTLYYIFL